MNLEKLLQQISDKLELLVDSVPQQTACKYKLHAWLDEWFLTYRAPVLKDGGYDLKNNIRKHIKPHIEDKPLNEYTAHDIVKALSLIKSERMRQICRQIYDQSFREAVRAGYIERNPVDNVDPVKHEYDDGRALSLSEQAELLRVTEHDRFTKLYRFYLLTGARPSEPLTVTWQHIVADTVHIPGTKTKGADRVIPMSQELRELIDQIPQSDSRLFPYTYQMVNLHFKKHALPKLSFEMTLKDFRHTFATRCAESGVNMRTLQKWMGHSKIETTARYYTHILTEFERSEIERLKVRKKDN